MSVRIRTGCLKGRGASSDESVRQALTGPPGAEVEARVAGRGADRRHESGFCLGEGAETRRGHVRLKQRIAHNPFKISTLIGVTLFSPRINSVNFIAPSSFARLLPVPSRPLGPSFPALPLLPDLGLAE